MRLHPDTRERSKRALRPQPQRRRWANPRRPECNPQPLPPIPASNQRYNTYLTVEHCPTELYTALQLLGHPKRYGIIEDAPVAPETPHNLQRQHRTVSSQGRWLHVAPTAPTGTVEPASSAKAAPRTAIQGARQPGEGAGRGVGGTREQGILAIAFFFP